MVTYLDRLRIDRDARTAPMTEELEACSKRLTELEVQQLQLRKQLEAIDVEARSLAAKKSSIKANVAEADRAYEQQVR